LGRRLSSRATIVDVASAAGVSVSTVSRVIRGHVDVQSATRTKVQAAIEAMGYRPSPIARALVSGETRLLALFVSDITNPFYPQLAKSVEHEAAKAGYTVVICNTGDRIAETHRHLTRLLGQGLDGVIHAAVGRDEATVLSVLGDHRRVVFINRPPADASVSYVVSDNLGGSRDLTRHLLSRGHRRIGFIGGPSFARNATDRLRGFTQAMAEVADATPFVVEAAFSRNSGTRTLKKWLDDECGLTAVIAINDQVALGAMELLVQRNLCMPADIALAGFDGTAFAASPIMSLTTVDQHIDEIGRQGVRLLLKQLGSERFVPDRQVLPTKLLLRNSTEGTALPRTRLARAQTERAPTTGAVRPLARADRPTGKARC
jgi:LacI family transcriptional regulator